MKVIRQTFISVTVIIILIDLIISIEIIRILTVIFLSDNYQSVL